MSPPHPGVVRPHFLLIHHSIHVYLQNSWRPPMPIPPDTMVLTVSFHSGTISHHTTDQSTMYHTRNSNTTMNRQLWASLTGMAFAVPLVGKKSPNQHIAIGNCSKNVLCEELGGNIIGYIARSLALIPCLRTQPINLM